MTYPAQTTPADSQETVSTGDSSTVLESWERVRDDGDLQFAPVEIPPVPPREPNAFERALRSFLEFLGDLFGPVGQAIAGAWPVLQWVVLGAVVLFVLYLIARTVGPLARQKTVKRTASEEPEWVPSAEQSLALLEDADRLAAQGQYDEATHLLLQRSVSHIASARPDWVEPSSTARELAALPALTAAARQAFGAISERVERSLFALRPLNREDWEAARAAYADFAQVRFDSKSNAQLALEAAS